MVEPPSPPYIPAEHQGGYQDTILRIVLHGTVSKTYCGGARDIASYFQNPTYVSSCHYVVDPCEEIQCVYDNTIAWHDGTNNNSIGVEMCDPVEGPLSRWDDDPHQQMLVRTATLVRQLCQVYGVPMRWINPEQIRAGEKGVCTHDDMSKAYPQNSDHWDPGAWPADQFMRLVHEESTADDQPPEEADMGSVPQTLPHSQEWTYAAFPVECGGSSTMIDQMWFTITSLWGATEYVLVFPDGNGGFTGPQSGGDIGSWDEPTMVESDTRRAYKLHEGMAAVGLYYRNKGGNTAAGVAFPQM